MKPCCVQGLALQRQTCSFLPLPTLGHPEIWTQHDWSRAWKHAFLANPLLFLLCKVAWKQMLEQGEVFLEGWPLLEVQMLQNRRKVGSGERLNSEGPPSAGQTTAAMGFCLP